MRYVFISLCFLFCFSTQAQKEKKEGAKAVLISVSAAVQSPAADMAKRFGTNYTAGVGAGIKTKSNWLFYADVHYLFGGNVKNLGQVFGPVTTDKGYILNQTGNYAEVNTFERGVYGLFEVARTFPKLGGINGNSGPTLSFGAGYIFNWIHFDVPGNDVPQILDDYKKGYDQLHAGPLLKQSIGYTYLSSNRRINLKLSFEIMQAFTQSFREFNYFTGQTDTENKLDLIYGIRLNWYLPIYDKSVNEFYYD